MELVLHHYWRSSSSWRVRWALALKGISYRDRAVDLLKGEQGASTFSASSPMGLVPCLVVDDRPLSESVAILEWLEEMHPAPPLLPKAPWRRARVRQLVELINAGTQPLQNLAVMRHVSTETDAQKAWATHWVMRGLQSIERDLAIIETEIGGGRFAVGDEITFADLFLVPQVYNARRFGIDLTAYPRLCAVEVAALSTDAAQSSHPDRFQPGK
ncbi:MAG: maleylacetoacetate isomerase [Polyangiales bacterium]